MDTQEASGATLFIMDWPNRPLSFSDPTCMQLKEQLIYKSEHILLLLKSTCNIFVCMDDRVKDVFGWQATVCKFRLNRISIVFYICILIIYGLISSFPSAKN
jgi:hypothetical protein